MSGFTAIYPAGTVAGEVLIKLFLKCNYAYRYSLASMFNAARLVTRSCKREATARGVVQIQVVEKSDSAGALRVIAMKRVE